MTGYGEWVERSPLVDVQDNRTREALGDCVATADSLAEERDRYREALLEIVRSPLTPEPGRHWRLIAARALEPGMDRSSLDGAGASHGKEPQ